MENKNIKKFIDFIITQKCTYNCVYCSQSKAQTKSKKNANRETISAFLKFLDNLDKDFEITVTGGEALLHPDFFEIIEKIKEKGFKINLITNLSFDVEKYDKIFSILNNSLNRFDISFHLDEIKDFDFLIEKLNKILELKPKNTKTVFLIPIYKINKDKELKINKILKTAKENNIDYDFQHIRILNKYIKNTKKEEKYVNHDSHITYSNLCYAGCLSAVIYENGECYRCYSSRFLNSNYLGNIKNKKFVLNKSPLPCIQKICTCPKPKIYNQILNKSVPIKATLLKLYNIIFMPYYFIKNIEIVKTKLKQYCKHI